MKQEDKELLKDLCARLPYGVKISVNDRIETLEGVHVLDGVVEYGSYLSSDIEDIKPYLFPLSSMTEEQKKDILCNGTFFISNRNELGRFPKHSDDYDYVTIDDYLMIYKKLIENHFDVNGLIEKGIAIDATGLNIY